MGAWSQNIPEREKRRTAPLWQNHAGYSGLSGVRVMMSEKTPRVRSEVTLLTEEEHGIFGKLKQRRGVKFAEGDPIFRHVETPAEDCG